MKKSILINLLILAATPIIGQDGHYWSQQYGTRSKLLGGVVSSDVEDLGATFYNPGQIALAENPSFLLSAKVYQYQKISLENSNGLRGEEFADSGLGSAPSLLAGSFNIKKLPKHRFAYSLLTRQLAQFNSWIRVSSDFDVIEDNPGTEFLAGEASNLQDLKEEWLGFTWSYALSPKIGVGVTNYLVLRDQNTSANISLEALTSQGITASALRLNEFSYNSTSLLWKIRFAIDLSPFSAGLSITTPRTDFQQW